MSLTAIIKGAALVVPSVLRTIIAYFGSSSAKTETFLNSNTLLKPKTVSVLSNRIFLIMLIATMGYFSGADKAIRYFETYLEILLAEESAGVLNNSGLIGLEDTPRFSVDNDTDRPINFVDNEVEK